MDGTYPPQPVYHDLKTVDRPGFPVGSPTPAVPGGGGDRYFAHCHRDRFVFYRQLFYRLNAGPCRVSALRSKKGGENMTSMKLTPQDILTQQFNARSKGFDKEEVTGFLAQVAELLENEILERDRLINKIDKLKKSLSKYENREDILRDTLIAAQKFSEEIKSNARKEAELITKEAEMKAEEIINGALSRQRELKEEIRNLKFKRQEIESDLLNMLNSLKELIESYRKDDEEFDKVEYLGK